MAHTQFLEKNKTKQKKWKPEASPKLETKALAQPSPAHQFRVSPWNWNLAQMLPRGSQPREAESPRHGVALGQLDHAGQVSSDTQRSHLPQLRHLFPRQASHTPHTACWGKGTKVRRVRLERQVGTKENWEPEAIK